MKTTVIPRWRPWRCLLSFCVPLLAGFLGAQQVDSPVAPSPATLARYDANRNGRLDSEELAAIRADEAKASRMVAAESNGSSGERPIELSPFEVRIDKDTGYQATSTLAGTRLRSDLKDIAASISVVTKDFMEDIAANDLESVLTYTLGTEVSGQGGNFSNADPGGAGEGLNFNGALERVTIGTRVRGLTSADTTRGFFPSSIPVDSYNMERVEISRGPNAMLFGLGSPSGIINNSLLRASLRKDATKVKHQMGSYGSARYEFDHDQTLIKDRLGVRVATMYDKTYYRIKPAYSEKQSNYLTASYRPFMNTAIRLSGEVGQQDQNRPQYRPPYDSTSMWWDLGKPTYNPATATYTYLGTPTTIPLSAVSGVTSGIMGWAGNNNIAFFYSDPNSSELGIPGTGAQGMKVMSNRVYRNAANTDWTTSSAMRMINNSNTYLNRVHLDEPSTSYWRMPSITDPKIYDFYHYHLDGPNKYEWGDWRAFNAVVEQRFFQNRAGVELVYDWQDMNFGAQQPLAYTDYNIRLDINSHLTNGQPNPNFLRPFIGGYGSARRNGEGFETGRATAYLDLDYTKKLPKWLGTLIGAHRPSGSFTRGISRVESLSGPAFASSPDYWLTDTAGVPPVAAANNNRRQVPQVRYIGPSILSVPDASGLRAQPLMASQWPTHLNSVRVLYHQPPATTATTPNPYVLRDWEVFSQPNKGITYTTGGSRRETTIDSTVVVDQARWFDGQIVGTAGWRRDTVKIRNAGVLALDPNTGLGNTDGEHYPLREEPNSSISGNSFNWGVVGHAPRLITERMPWGTQFSVSYNTADNFRVTGPRENLYGVPIGPESGQSREWSFRLSTFNGRFELRTTYYQNDTLKSATPAFATSINNLVDAVNGVIDNNYSGVNDTTPLRLAGKAAWDEWMKSPEGTRYMKVFRFQQVSPTDWSAERRGTVVGTTDVAATGVEYDLIFNPTRHWRISFNVARQQAVRSNIGKEYIDVLENFKAMAAGPGGSALSSGTAIFRDQFRNNTLNPANPVILQEGAPSNELRKWRWNFVTNYSFSEGFLKGVGVGGATRIQDKSVIGYRYANHPTLGPAPDVWNPYYGEARQNFDAWVSYGRRIGRQINWKVQLNVKNIGIGNELIPIAANPDGSISTWTIAEPQRWTLTNSFTF